MAHNDYGIFGGASGTAGLEAYFLGYIFQRNLLADAIESRYPANNFYPASLDDALFVDRLAEDYRLSISSPYRNQGTDGKDIGCDILQLHAAVGIQNGPGNLIMWGAGRGTHGYKYPYEPYLSWTDNSSDEEEFIIERKTGSNAYQLIYTEAARVAAGVTTYPLGSLGNGGTFRVRAVNARGKSIVSNPVETYSY